MSHRWEAAVLVGFLLAVAAGAVSSTGEDCDVVKENVLRLRVIANSDSPLDQAVKLCVRDVIVQETNALFQQTKPSGREEGKKILLEHTDALTAAAEQKLSACGFAYGASISLRTERFPVRRYGERLLPAGEYESLCVELGEGRGQNWWCVLFPQLCLPAVTDGWQDLPDVTQTGRISVRVALWDWIQELFQRT